MEKKVFCLFAMIIVAVSTMIFTSCGDDDDKENMKEKNLSGSIIKKISVNGVEFNMILVEGGTFKMGATDEQILSGEKIGDDEFPVHNVTLSSYWLAETEVTNELYYAVFGREYNDDILNYRPCYGDFRTFERFIEKLNEVSGFKFRFPTEAEWEYAARGGNKSMGYIYSGSDNKNLVGWFYCNSGDNYLAESDWNWWRMTGNGCDTHVVGTKKPNELGFYDMSGNLSEWCSDWYGLYRKEDQINPKGPETGTYKTSRGGAYALFSNEARCSHRKSNPLDERVYWGLRLAMDK